MSQPHDLFANIWDQQIHDEIALRNAEPLVTYEYVYAGYGDYDLVEVECFTAEDEQRAIPFPPPEAHFIPGAPAYMGDWS